MAFAGAAPVISFAPGPSRPLSYLRSVAVDPHLIPLGRHIDVFRPPPSNPSDQGNFATGERVYIIAPGRPLP